MIAWTYLSGAHHQDNGQQNNKGEKRPHCGACVIVRANRAEQARMRRGNLRGAANFYLRTRRGCVGTSGCLVPYESPPYWRSTLTGNPSERLCYGLVSLNSTAADHRRAAYQKVPKAKISLLRTCFGSTHAISAVTGPTVSSSGGLTLGFAHEKPSQSVFTTKNVKSGATGPTMFTKGNCIIK